MTEATDSEQPETEHRIRSIRSLEIGALTGRQTPSTNGTDIPSLLGQSGVESSSNCSLPDQFVLSAVVYVACFLLGLLLFCIGQFELGHFGEPLPGTVVLPDDPALGLPQLREWPDRVKLPPRPELSWFAAGQQNRQLTAVQERDSLRVWGLGLCAPMLVSWIFANCPIVLRETTSQLQYLSLWLMSPDRRRRGLQRRLLWLLASLCGMVWSQKPRWLQRFYETCSLQEQFEISNVRVQRDGGHEPRWTLNDTENSRTTNRPDTAKNCPPSPLEPVVRRWARYGFVGWPARLCHAAARQVGAEETNAR